MLNNSSADGLSMRPSRPADGPFLQSLYQSARPELQWIDADPEVIEQVVAQQLEVQNQGIGEHFPNAMHYVVEKLDTPIGVLSADFGPNEIRVLYLAFVPGLWSQRAARGTEGRPAGTLPGDDGGLGQQPPGSPALPGAGVRG